MRDDRLHNKDNKMLLAGVLCILCVSVRLTEGVVSPIKVPKELQDLFDASFHIGDLYSSSGHLVFWRCLENYMAKFMKHDGTVIPTDVREQIMANITVFMEPLMPTKGRKKRQAIVPRIRREIRDMPRRDLVRYFQAVNRLKREEIIPSRGGRPALTMYDMLARLHSGDVIRTAHGGPAFLSWHRIFLWIYESYLRLFDATITIPYWGSVLDSNKNITESPIFTSQFFGGGTTTISEPFAEWRRWNEETAFVRMFSNPAAQLITYEQIARVLSKRRNWQIMLPTAEENSNFEQFHGGPHVAVGGNMNNLNDAVMDPIFYSHHAFCDMIWENFRLQQRTNGIRAGRDYPYSTDGRFRDGHGPLDRTRFLLPVGTHPNGTVRLDRRANYQNYIGYSEVFFELVQYAPLPSCAGTGRQNTCTRNRYMQCVNNQCFSRSAAQLQTGGRGRNKRAVLTADGTCQRQPLLSDNKYSYMDNQVSTSYGSSLSNTANTNKWVYIPVQIISKRNPTYKSFTDYSLYKGFRNMLGDKNMFTQSGDLQCFDNCKKSQDSVGRLRIMSYGLNYYGYNEEYAIVDNRFSMSQTSGFVPVKDPIDGASEAMIVVVDSCGRVCRPYCKSYGSSLKKSAGAIRVTTASPKQYYQNYGEATLTSWNVDSPDACPKQDERYIPVTFFCEYTEKWIWNTPSTSKPAPPTGYLDDTMINQIPVTQTGTVGGTVPDTVPVPGDRRYTGRVNGSGSRGGARGGGSRGGVRGRGTGRHRVSQPRGHGRSKKPGFGNFGRRWQQRTKNARRRYVKQTGK